MTLLQFHLIVVCFWLGILAAETVLELCPSDASGRRMVALIHRRIDLWCEIPATVLVFASGLLLFVQVEVLTPLLLVKVGAGLLGVIAQWISVPLVSARAKETDDERVQALTRTMLLTALAYPFIFVALVIGLFYLP